MLTSLPAMEQNIMNKASIIEALRTLDVAEDGHWTTDGMPRLDVIQEKFPGITRQMITQVAPVFSRKKPSLPDLAALREQAEQAALDADEAVRVASEKAAVADRQAKEVAKLDAPIHDRHTLTRANHGWVKSQLAGDVDRARRQKALDGFLKEAGGIDHIGAHPVERAIASRVITARKNIVVNTKKEKQA